MLSILLLATWDGKFYIPESTCRYYTDVWEKDSWTVQANEGWPNSYWRSRRTIGFDEEASKWSSKFNAG